MNRENPPTKKSNNSKDKKSWISPKITKWENENIEIGFALGPDGVTRS